MQDKSDRTVDRGASHVGRPAGGVEMDFPFFPGLEPKVRQAVAGLMATPVQFRNGQHLARIGDPFHDLYLVSSGSFKAYSDDTTGREHVAGFFLPGDAVGFDAIYTGRYRANFAALADGVVVVLHYAHVRTLFERFPPLLSEVLRMMSRNIARNEVFSGDYSAEERLAGFITMMAGRYRPLHGVRGQFALSMSRRDIANYLRLAPETVSRLFTRFAKDGLIRMMGREIVLLKPDGMRTLAGGMDQI